MSEAEAYYRFFEVKLDLFDGPIDLLLHLVKKRELPIEKVSLADVTVQYLECIRGLRYYDVEVAAEYLVIAATLLSVKASVLLNDPVELVPDQNGDLVDPHEELLRRLKELETFRAAAGVLASIPQLGTDVFGSAPRSNKIDPSAIPLADHESSLLVRAFQEVLTRLGERSTVYQVALDTVSIVERMRDVVDELRTSGGKTTFATLLLKVPDRAAAIGTFIALLELCRRRMIAVSQNGPFTEIDITLSETEAADSKLGDQAENDSDLESKAIEVAA